MLSQICKTTTVLSHGVALQNSYLDVPRLDSRAPIAMFVVHRIAFIYVWDSFNYFCKKVNRISYYFALFALSMKCQFSALEGHKASSSDY